MDYKSFFKDYPGATLLKVGDRHFPSHLRGQAEFEARRTGDKLEEVTSAVLAGAKGAKEQKSNGAE